jgi:hypothetical protein
MNKLLISLVFLTGITYYSTAQTKSGSQLSLGGEFGFPTGQASQVYGTVLGASAKLELPVSASPFYFTLTSGLSEYIVRLDYTGVIKNTAYGVPLEAGGKYYFTKIGYCEADFGASANISSNYPASRMAFIYAPVIGFSAATNKHKSTIDIGMRYEGRVESGGTVSQVAFRLAYRFGI